jgi:hypothetical protein
MNLFTPQLASGQPGIPAQVAQPMPMAQPVAPPVAQATPVQKIFVPVPVMVPEKKPAKMMISNEAIRKAQSIYPIEQQAKAKMIDQAKTTPTPTGAWGAAK